MMIRQPVKAYFIATNGAITIWRPFRRPQRIYRSVEIKEFSRAWHASRPSGPRSYPTVQVPADVFRELLLAKVQYGRPEEDWLANEHLPREVRKALALGLVDELVDQIDTEGELMLRGAAQ